MSDEAFIEFLNAVEAGIQSAREMLAEKHGVGNVSETIFTSLLGWEQRTGSKLRNFEVTSRKANNNSDAFNHAFNILKANNASINQRFHGEGYAFAYWLFKDNIYRQKLKNSR